MGEILKGQARRYESLAPSSSHVEHVKLALSTSPELMETSPARHHLQVMTTLHIHFLVCLQEGAIITS